MNPDDVAELREIEETARARREVSQARASIAEERRRAKVAAETPGAIAAEREAVSQASAAVAAYFGARRD